MRVCIVTMEIGFSSPGGIGTAYTGLALALVERGHDVTVLFVDDNRHTREEWVVILAPLKRIQKIIKIYTYKSTRNEILLIIYHLILLDEVNYNYTLPILCCISINIL